jgi:isopenicillin-N epimerase
MVTTNTDVSSSVLSLPGFAKDEAITGRPIGEARGHTPLAFSPKVWALDPTLTFLNHGSYGSTPRSVLETQSELRARMERDPVRFFKVDLERLMDQVRERIGAFVNCRPQDIAPMPNATVALNTVLANTALRAGDEVLITDHEYMSLVNELERVCPKAGATVVKAKVPFPLRSADEVFDAVMSCVTPRTRIAFLAHITSATSLIFPITRLVRTLMDRGIEVCVDGAHTPGQIQVDIRGLNPTYYVGSFHKWLSAPKGTGFLYVRSDKQTQPGLFRPLSLSSRAHKVRPERALYLRDFDYVGTDDYSGMLSVPAAIDALGSMLPGGWPELYRVNHELAVQARDIVARALGTTPPAPDSMLGMMATLLLPEPAPEMLSRPTLYDDPLQDRLIENHKIVVPIWRLADNRRVVRLSAQLYNTPEQYERLGHALREELALEHPRRAIA